MSTRRGRLSRSGGFTINELLMVVAVASTLAGVSVPAISGAMRAYEMNSSTRQVAAEIRGARFTAVAKNRTMRVRFNCPGPGQFRVVEVTGNAGIDNDQNRCAEANYPYPDPNPAAAPNADGPVMWLNNAAAFGAVQDVQITTRGRIQPLTGCPAACVAGLPPASIELDNGHETKVLTISASGTVTIPQYSTPKY